MIPGRTRSGSIIGLAVAAGVIALVPGEAGGGPERPVPAADKGPVERLCGLAAPLASLFGCTAVGSTDSAAQQPAGGGIDETSSAQDVRVTSDEPRYVPDLLVVSFKRGTPSRTVAAVLARAGVTLERSIVKIGVRVVRVAPVRRAEALATLRSSRWVDTAEQDAVFEALETTTPNDAHWPSQWGLHLTGFVQAWDVTRGLRSVIVAVVDTGVDGGHPDLRGALLPGADLVNGDTDAGDDHGHGTAAAGVIAARTNNSEGQAGVCWNCTLLPIKALDADGIGNSSLIAAAIVRAVDLGARVINLSLGGPASTEALAAAVSYAIQRDVVVVAAAGNSGVDKPFYPAGYPGVISVAASDESDRLYSWSNRGEWVAVAAPGCNVAPGHVDGYVGFCGTSSAAPVVAGLAALALSARPGATGEAVRRAIETSAGPAIAGVRHGRIQPSAALSALGVRPRAASAMFRGTLGSAVRSRTYGRVVGSGPLTARLGFAAPRALTLSVVNARGVRMARRSRPSPLRLTVRLRGGTYRLVVSGKVRRAGFVLLVSHTRSSVR